MWIFFFFITMLTCWVMIMRQMDQKENYSQEEMCSCRRSEWFICQCKCFSKSPSHCNDWLTALFTIETSVIPICVCAFAQKGGNGVWFETRLVWSMTVGEQLFQETCIVELQTLLFTCYVDTFIVMIKYCPYNRLIFFIFTPLPFNIQYMKHIRLD